MSAAISDDDSTIQEIPEVTPRPSKHFPNGGKHGGMVLPVDEDDYLTPKSANPAAYMDILPDGTIGEHQIWA